MSANGLLCRRHSCLQASRPSAQFPVRSQARHPDGRDRTSHSRTTKHSQPRSLTHTDDSPLLTLAARTATFSSMRPTLGHARLRGRQRQTHSHDRVNRPIVESTDSSPESLILKEKEILPSLHTASQAGSQFTYAQFHRDRSRWNRSWISTSRVARQRKHAIEASKSRKVKGLPRDLCA